MWCWERGGGSGEREVRVLGLHSTPSTSDPEEASPHGAGLVGLGP